MPISLASVSGTDVGCRKMTLLIDIPFSARRRSFIQSRRSFFDSFVIFAVLYLNALSFILRSLFMK